MRFRGGSQNNEEPELHETLVRPLVELFLGVIFLLIVASAFAFAEPARHVDLYCHRTANQDVPENTIESLDQAALLGCDYVEVDVRRTLDGVLVLNHDGFLERLSDGIGEIEQSYYADLQLRDFGAWMSPRFAGLHIATFADALRTAQRDHIQIILDIKTSGLVTDILSALREENMLDRVRWPPDSDEVRKLVPNANIEVDESWVQPGVSSAEVARLHGQHKRVIVNFSANGHELDIQAMKDAVCAGADGINVDFPRIGAEAVGRPVEQRVNELIGNANTGDAVARSKAILTLARYEGFSLTQYFSRWLLDSDDRVSRAAAVALVSSRPHPEPSIFDAAVRSTNPAARANSAWALGQLRAPASRIVPLLSDNDPHVLAEALVGLSRMPGAVSSKPLIALLRHGPVTVRGPAALALAAHDPEHASTPIAAQLQAEVKLARASYDHWAAQNKPKLSQSEIDVIVGFYRCQMKMVQALALLRDSTATHALEAEAFRPDLDFSQENGVVAAFQLSDRVAANPSPELAALGSDPVAANRAEWMLIQAGPAVLPAVRQALANAGTNVRERLLEIQRLVSPLSAQ